MSGVVIASLVALSGWGVAASIRADRRSRAARELVQRLQQERQPIYCGASNGSWFQVVTINAERSARRPFVVEICPDRIALHPIGADQAPLVLPPTSLRWFGRPRKYMPGTNEIWLHVELDGTWRLIKLRLVQDRMRLLVRALKEVATEDQVKAYRRMRPYIHYGPLAAHPAQQDMLGAWSLGEPVALYLTPLHLVILQGSRVLRALPLADVQAIGAVRRADAPGAAGLVRFTIGDETLAFALDDYERFAAALGEAAKRTLEDPVQWQRKKKKPGSDWDEWDDEE